MEATVAGGRLLGLSAGTRIGGVPAVVVSTTVSAASAGGIVGSLSQSQLGNLGEKLVNSQFSQRQEAEADDYSYDLLRQRGISPAGLATSFEKLAKLEEGRQSSMFDDHPASAERAQHIRDRMSADGIK